MTIETYAERLRKKRKAGMTNYDLDEIERERDRNAFASAKSTSVTLQDDEAFQTVEIEIDHKDLLKLALAAHDRDITLNKMCSTIIVDSMDSLDYKFEHQTKPQVLKEY
tara:strand:+ start:182 stop:508 length:327 start_codon:yes stop_codon:yes gene_type:complete